MADIHASKQSPAHQENENPLLSGAIKLPEFKDRIVTGWRRFSSGHWRVPEGDIYSAYCAHQFPKLNSFVEGGHLFTTTGITLLGGAEEASCHILLPAGSVEVPKKPYSHEGQIGKFKGKSWILGPLTTFVSEDPPVSEWQKILRAQYADGGYFANQPNYSEFLLSLDDEKMTENKEAAIKSEHAGEFLNLSKAAMVKLLDSPPRPNASGGQQLPLF